MIIRPYPGFIIPTSRFVDVELPSAKVGASGRFQLIKRNAEGIELFRTPWTDNIILDTGLNQWATGTPIVGAAIGTGTSTPNSSQTQLESLSHYTTTGGTGNGTVAAAGVSPYNNTKTFVYRTALGALNGNYAEVGVGWASNTMFSRARILDGGGSPTTISVGSGEQLDIVYQLSVYPPLVDVGPTAITISGVGYTVTGRAANVNSTTSWNVPNTALNGAVGSFPRGTNQGLGVITSGPSGTNPITSDYSRSVSAYTNNSLQLVQNLTFGLTAANYSGGWKSIQIVWLMGEFQYEFSPILPKDSTKTAAFSFSMNWARRP